MSNAGSIDTLLEIMAKLRDPARGCPWDLEQDFHSILPHTLEEAYEVAEAIERGDPGDLRDELGDLLFQVVFHARLAEELGHFDFHDVVRSVAEKLVRRHPHVFGDERVESADQQTRAWEAHKERERRARSRDPAAHSHLDGISVSLPALTRAVKLQRRAARVGFDWSSLDGVLEKIDEELDELKTALSASDPQQPFHELGDLLFSCVNLARHLDKEPETVLRAANSRFEERFRRMEALLQSRGMSVAQADAAELDAAWEEIKTET